MTGVVWRGVTLGAADAKPTIVAIVKREVVNCILKVLLEFGIEVSMFCNSAWRLVNYILEYSTKSKLLEHKPSTSSRSAIRTKVDTVLASAMSERSDVGSLAPMHLKLIKTVTGEHEMKGTQKCCFGIMRF